ncbi:hypothetical protein A7982_12394 [Minicystis rosea]|nr:hypothetical protein A7982_12394 [Minicystis rosea]
MRRSTCLVPAALLLAVVGAGCAKDHRVDGTRSAAASASSNAPSAASARDPRRLVRIDAGMSEARVTELLGRPDEIRTDDGHHPWIAGAAAAWAYGVDVPFGFAFGGVVLFDADRNVLMTRSPIDAATVRVRKLRWSDTADVNDRGLSCHLAIQRAEPSGMDAEVRLRNDGPAAFERRHGHTGIAFDLVVELFDEQKRLLARYDTLSLFSPHAPDDTALMTIPAGGSIAERVRIGAPWADLGALPRGRYLVRVAFPFEVGRFSVSEPVAVRVEG